MKRALRVLGLGIGLLSAATAAAGDKQLPQPAPGTRVRISAPGVADRPLVGTIASLDAGSVSLQIQGRAEPVVVPRERITRFEVSAGRRSRAVDALIGAAVGGAAGAAAGSNTSQFRDAATAGAGLLGALVGALIGAAIPPGERWNEVSVAGHPLTFMPSLDHGTAVVFALKF